MPRNRCEYDAGALCDAALTANDRDAVEAELGAIVCSDRP